MAKTKPEENRNLASDISRGATAIAKYLFNKTDKRHIRRVYGLVDAGVLPVFREGKVICLRHSTYTAAIAAQEAATRKVGG